MCVCIAVTLRGGVDPIIGVVSVVTLGETEGCSEGDLDAGICGEMDAELRGDLPVGTGACGKVRALDLTVYSCVYVLCVFVCVCVRVGVDVKIVCACMFGVYISY